MFQQQEVFSRDESEAKKKMKPEGEKRKRRRRCWRAGSCGGVDIEESFEEKNPQSVEISFQLVRKCKTEEEKRVKVGGLKRVQELRKAVINWVTLSCGEGDLRVFGSEEEVKARKNVVRVGFGEWEERRADWVCGGNSLEPRRSWIRRRLTSLWCLLRKLVCDSLQMFCFLWF